MLFSISGSSSQRGIATAVAYFFAHSRPIVLQRPLNRSLTFSIDHVVQVVSCKSLNATPASANAPYASLPCIVGLTLLTGAHSSPAVSHPRPDSTAASTHCSDLQNSCLIGLDRMQKAQWQECEPFGCYTRLCCSFTTRGAHTSPTQHRGTWPTYNQCCTAAWRCTVYCCAFPSWNFYVIVAVFLSPPSQTPQHLPDWPHTTRSLRDPSEVE